MFSKRIQQKLIDSGYEINCEEENIWIKEMGDSSVTISGDDNNIDAIWQNFDGDFDELSSSSITEIIEWSDNMFGE